MFCCLFGFVVVVVVAVVVVVVVVVVDAAVVVGVLLLLLLQYKWCFCHLFFFYFLACDRSFLVCFVYFIVQNNAVHLLSNLGISGGNIDENIDFLVFQYAFTRTVREQFLFFCLFIYFGSICQ